MVERIGKNMANTKKILILKHIGIEGPGSIEEFFKNTAWGLKIVDLGKKEPLPDSLEGIGAIISLGGPMSVYEEDKYRFLQDEGELLKKSIQQEVPILGICLGAQLLARACGAKVKKAAVSEIGWNKVSLTKFGKNDPLFTALPNELEVFQWHEDTFEIPEGAVHLAASRVCLNQAFRSGKNAYGLQFHIEVTPEMVGSWIKRYAPKGCPAVDARDMLVEAYRRRQAFEKQAGIIYLNFARVIAGS